ncbi:MULTISPECIES: DUF3992 domain-containing protein [Bacillus]|uniref:DUF3992 domain-containing protein n=1 Tax=Bacillus TaxID=1386 RepID=UPI0002411C07|nr:MULTISPECIES: S-Ena type endospore appendage [Bacillus cereus group]MRC18042.1 DUF3992 domain-containing protein [Bacillus thuringiensis]EHL76111.1 hypothetical protein HMPREF1014_01235 [Bacillus sp. 7_6_55CFAA_CT2]MBY0014822.1 DUF3992 domain-containing protein [Bacillus cereus]MCU4729929.1 DUF3992 domain-containing protein [Bacillus cereus]MCU4996962.1 DUF3992 domain-containing protein [Bacillus cereus]
MNKVICCTPSAIIKDKICIPWSITGGEMGIQTIYTNNLLNHISSTGYIKYETGVQEIGVTFFQDTNVLNSIIIQPGSVSNFTMKNFTSIQITTGFGLHQGEFCITVSYQF